MANVVVVGVEADRAVVWYELADVFAYSKRDLLVEFAWPVVVVANCVADLVVLGVGF